MRVLSVSPLRAGSVIWQPRRGAFALTVVARATFNLVPGEAVFSEDQEFPNEEDNHWNDDPARSLYAPTDIVPRKARADVLLVGHAFAPDGDPVRWLRVRLGVGAIDKEIAIFGERGLTPDGRLIEGPPFSKMQLRYERAAGGEDTENPVGMRTGLRARGEEGALVPLPNLVHPRSAAPRPDEVIAPIGFGPIAASWPTRRRLLGAGEAVVRDGGWRRAPLPEGADLGYFNVAPLDQQVDRISDVERITLENLHPEHDRLVTRLPGLRPRVLVQRLRVAPAEVAMKADTLWIDTDRAICTLAWRGQVDLESPEEIGRVLIAMEQGAQRLDFEEVLALAPPFAPEGAFQPRSPAETFHGGAASGPTPRAPSEPSPVPGSSPPPPLPPRRVTASTMPVLGSAPVGALPFQLNAASALAAPPPPVEAAPTQKLKRRRTSTSSSLEITISEDNLPAPRDAAPSWLAPSSSPRPAETLPFAATETPPRATFSAARPGPLDATELLWFAPAFVSGIRKTWRPLLADRARDGADADEAICDDLLHVLGAGQPLDASGLEGALETGVGTSGRFRAPLVLLRGVLRFPFDADLAREAREALTASNGRHVEADLELSLLRRRSYQRRTLLGEDQIRALFAHGAAEGAVPAYLPAATAKVLPMFASMKARIIAEARPQQDRYEDHPVALRVVALGWEISVGRRAAGAR